MRATTLSTAKHWKSVSENIWRLDGDYFLCQPRPFRLWLADLAFLYSLATIERAHKMLWNGRVVLFCFLLWSFHLPGCWKAALIRGHRLKLALRFTPLFYSQLYLPILLALYFAYCIMQTPCNPVAVY